MLIGLVINFVKTSIESWVFFCVFFCLGFFLIFYLKTNNNSDSAKTCLNNGNYVILSNYFVDHWTKLLQQ